MVGQAKVVFKSTIGLSFEAASMMRVFGRVKDEAREIFLEDRLIVVRERVGVKSTGGASGGDGSFEAGVVFEGSMGRSRFPTAVRGRGGMEAVEEEGVADAPAGEAELVGPVERADKDADQTRERVEEAEKEAEKVGH